MSELLMSWPIGIFIVSFFGWLLVGTLMHLLRRVCLEVRIPFRDSFRALDFVVGTTERLVTLVLTANHSAYLPVFIGAWMTFKFAAHWQRISTEAVQVSEQSLLALVGGVISFSFAISIGIAVDPTALPWLKGLSLK